jgi:hypothetical protein
MDCIQGSTHITKDDIESVFALYDRVSQLLFYKYSEYLKRKIPRMNVPVYKEVCWHLVIFANFHPCALGSQNATFWGQIIFPITKKNCSILVYMFIAVRHEKNKTYRTNMFAIFHNFFMCCCFFCQLVFVCIATPLPFPYSGFLDFILNEPTWK